MRRLLGAVLGVLAVLAVVPAAGAASGPATPTPSSVDDLLDVYGVDSEPADFVVVVDTSGSMMWKPALYPPVVRAYRQFVEAIGDNDQLSLITFDTTPNLRFAGDLSTPDKRKKAAAALPARANGAHTDIGAALGAALDRLERPDASEVQTLVFLTDGKIDAPGSPYANPAGRAWKALADRAATVADGHRLSVYGAGLGSRATDVGVLQRVFPSTQIVSLPPDQLPAFFAEAVERARVQRLVTPVTAELTEQYVSVEVDAGELAAATDLTVRLRSHLPHLGARVVVSGVTVATDDGAPVRATLVGGPTALSLSPDGTSDPLTVRIEPTMPPDRLVGDETQRQRFAVTLDATVEGEPADVLAQQVGVSTEARLVQSDLVAAQRTVGIPLWWFAVAAAVLVLLILVALWVYRRFLRTPPLPGGVTVLPSAADPQGAFIPFRGKVMAMPNKDAAIAATDGAIVEFYTQRGRFTRGNPRVYVRPLDGSCRVEDRGLIEALSAEGRRVYPEDRVIVGRAHLAVESRKR